MEMTRHYFLTIVGEAIQRDFMGRAYNTLKWSSEALNKNNLEYADRLAIKCKGYDEFKLYSLEYITIVEGLKNILNGPDIQNYIPYKFKLKDFFPDINNLKDDVKNAIEKIESEEVYVLETLFEQLYSIINGTVAEIFTLLTFDNENEVVASISDDVINEVQKCMNGMIDKYVRYNLIYIKKDTLIQPYLHFEPKEQKIENEVPQGLVN